MIAHPSIQDLNSEAELTLHNASPLAIAGYRRQMTFRIPGARRQDWVLGTMGFALHRDANFSRFMTAISRNRTHQGYSPEGFCQECFKAVYFLFQALRNKKYCCICLIYYNKNFF
jgi:hypothetical protein